MGFGNYYNNFQAQTKPDGMIEVGLQILNGSSNRVQAAHELAMLIAYKYTAEETRNRGNTITKRIIDKNYEDVCQKLLGSPLSSIVEYAIKKDPNLNPSKSVRDYNTQVNGVPCKPLGFVEASDSETGGPLGFTGPQEGKTNLGFL